MSLLAFASCRRRQHRESARHLKGTRLAEIEEITRAYKARIQQRNGCVFVGTFHGSDRAEAEAWANNKASLVGGPVLELTEIASTVTEKRGLYRGPATPVLGGVVNPSGGGIGAGFVRIASVYAEFSPTLRLLRRFVRR